MVTKRRPDPKKPKPEKKKFFTVGPKEEGHDFTQEEINHLIMKIAYWFRSDECDRQYDDPIKEATQRVQECLLAQTSDGRPWVSAPSDFVVRVKVKCAFDLKEDKGIKMMRAKSPRARGVPTKDEAKKSTKTMAKTNPVSATFDQEKFREQLETSILNAFPELDNPAHRPNVRSLSLYHAQREVIDRELAMNPTARLRSQLLESLKKVEETADVVMQRLGIHPNQLRQKISEKTAASVGELTAMVHDDQDFRRLDKIWALQLALQLWWMWEHRDGTMSGRQISDFEFWHLTRTRPIKFTCRHGEEYVVVEGFEPHEIRDYLVKEGVAIEEPVLPGFFQSGDLDGLAAYFQPAMEGSTNGEGDSGAEAPTTGDGGRGDADPGVSGDDASPPDGEGLLDDVRDGEP